MLDVEVFGSRLLADPLPLGKAERLCVLALASAGIDDGHIAIEFVGEQRIAQLNAEHRGKEGPTDVLSFPIDGVTPPGGAIGDATGDGDGDEDGDDGAGEDEDRGAGEGDRGAGEAPRELGDIVICPQHTRDIPEAILHGALHLLGMDHETDEGEMLALQAELLRWESA